ncbi:MAG TPA: hypothetical protein V6C78_34110 [Crinalium sp.]|jgi:trans-aconitate methyltransferase
MSNQDEFYDNPEIRAKYIARRTQPDNPNDTLERPIFLDLVGNLKQLDIIDLGCGDASFGKEALLQGARSYIGIEASSAMVDLALATLTHPSGKVHHQRIETWKAQSEQADWYLRDWLSSTLKTSNLCFKKRIKPFIPVDE